MPELMQPVRRSELALLKKMLRSKTAKVSSQAQAMHRVVRPDADERPNFTRRIAKLWWSSSSLTFQAKFPFNTNNIASRSKASDCDQLGRSSIPRTREDRHRNEEHKVRWHVPKQPISSSMFLRTFASQALQVIVESVQ
jgi:hypothetical protein